MKRTSAYTHTPKVDSNQCWDRGSRRTHLPLCYSSEGGYRHRDIREEAMSARVVQRTRVSGISTPHPNPASTRVLGIAGSRGAQLTRAAHASAQILRVSGPTTPAKEHRG